MTCSPARLEANRRNSLHSTGPRTEEGKATSRVNALKHGLACETIAASAGEAAEVVRRTRAFVAEMKPDGEIQTGLLARAALLSVRLERCSRHESAAITENITRAVAEFDEAIAEGEGKDATPEAIARAREHVAKLALFDPSPEACRARRHEADAERGMFRAFREFQALKAAGAKSVEAARPAVEAARNAAMAEAQRSTMASFRAASRAIEKEPATVPIPIPVGASQVPQSPDPAITTQTPRHLNRRQRRAALAKRA